MPITNIDPHIQTPTHDSKDTTEKDKNRDISRISSGRNPHSQITPETYQSTLGTIYTTTLPSMDQPTTTTYLDPSTENSKGNTLPPQRTPEKSHPTNVQSNKSIQ